MTGTMAGDSPDPQLSMQDVVVTVSIVIYDGWPMELRQLRYVEAVARHRHFTRAAAELIVEGVNGFTCASTDPDDVASAILRVHDAGDALRRATLAWFRANAADLTMDESLLCLLGAYRRISGRGETGA